MSVKSAGKKEETKIINAKTKKDTDGDDDDNDDKNVTKKISKKDARLIGRWYIYETLGKGGYSWLI